MPASALARRPGRHEAVAAPARLARCSPPSRADRGEAVARSPTREIEPEPSRRRRPASGFTCPECGGALWELREGELVRYRCRVGHSYSEAAMVDAQGSAVEAALWTALEVLEERSELLRRIADAMDAQPRTAERFRAGAREAEDRAAASARILHSGSARRHGR